MTEPGPRTGARRLISAWEYRHLRGCGVAHLAAGVVQGGLGAVTFSRGGKDAKTYGWTAFWLLMCALNIALGRWERTIARSG